MKIRNIKVIGGCGLARDLKQNNFIHFGSPKDYKFKTIKMKPDFIKAKERGEFFDICDEYYEQIDYEKHEEYLKNV